MSRLSPDKFYLTSSSAGEDEDWDAWIGSIAAHERRLDPLSETARRCRTTPEVLTRLDAVARKIDENNRLRRRVTAIVLLLGLLSAALQGANFVYLRYYICTA